jgi:serine/threonine protein kinase
MLVTSSDAFFKILEQSELLTSEHLEEARQAGDEDPKSVARRLVKSGQLTVWQAGQLLAGRHALHIGKYKLLDQLGSGTLSRVYLAEHVQMGRRVVIKALARRHAGNPDAVERFLAEARSLASLDHRNLVHVYDVDSANDQNFLVMEYVEGRDLERVVEDDRPVPYARIADYVRQAAEGLSHAHSSGQVHLAVKPSNILVDDEGSVKVLGTGVAQLADLSGAGDANGEDKTARNVDFIAPEQTQAGSKVDHRADIYSLGCTFYFLLAGHPPFPKGTDAQKIDQHQKAEPRSILYERPDAPRSLVKICQKMTAKAAADRYASARAVAQALDNWLGENEEQIPPPEKKKEANGAASKPAAAKGAAKDTPPPIKARPSDTPSAGLKPSAVVPPARRSGAQPAARQQAKGAPIVAVDDGARSAAAGDGRRASVTARKRSNPILVIGGLLAAGVLAVGLILAVAFLLPPSRPGTNKADKDRAEIAKRWEEEDPAPANTSPDPAAGHSEESGTGTTQPPADPVSPIAAMPPVNPGGTAAAPPPPMADPGGTDGTPPMNNTPPPAGNSEPRTNDPAGTAIGGTEEPKPTPPAGNGGDVPKDPGGKTPKPATNPMPAPPAAVNPFANLPAAVDLPAHPKPTDAGVDGAVPIVIGPVELDADAICLVELFGGDDAHKGRISFSMAGTRKAIPEREWEVRSRAARSADSPETPVGYLRIGEEGVSFRWTTEALGDQLSNYLRNCLVRFRSGVYQHMLALRAPVEFESAPMNFDKIGVSYRPEVEWLPTAESLKLEVVSFSDGFPDHRFQSGQVVDGARGTVVVACGREPSIMAVKVDSSIQVKTLMVKAEPYFFLPLDPKGTKFTKQSLDSAEVALGNFKAAANARIADIDALLKKPDDQVPKARKQVLREVEKPEVERQRDLADSALKRLPELRKYYEELNNKATVYVRLVHTAEGQRVVLAQTTGTPDIKVEAGGAGKPEPFGGPAEPPGEGAK